jgi:hypothetical protein
MPLGSQLSSTLSFDLVSDSTSRSSSAFLAGPEIVKDGPALEDRCIRAQIRASCRSGFHLILDERRNTSHPGLSHEPFTRLAEAELSAYYRTMVEQYGVAIADIAVERWLDAFARSDMNREDPQRSLRRTTISAIADVVSREFAPENICASTRKRRNRL